MTSEWHTSRCALATFGRLDHSLFITGAKNTVDPTFTNKNNDDAMDVCRLQTASRSLYGDLRGPKELDRFIQLLPLDFMSQRIDEQKLPPTSLFHKRYPSTGELMQSVFFVFGEG